jgi:hypothetical protein
MIFGDGEENWWTRVGVRTVKSGVLMAKVRLRAFMRTLFLNTDESHGVGLVDILVVSGGLRGDGQRVQIVGRDVPASRGDRRHVVRRAVGVCRVGRDASGCGDAHVPWCHILVE